MAIAVAGGLVVLMAGMLMIVGVAAFTVVMAIRRERRDASRRPGRRPLSKFPPAALSAGGAKRSVGSSTRVRGQRGPANNK